MERCLYGEKNDIEKVWKKFVCNFNPSNNSNIEWDNLKSQVKEYTKIHQTNGRKIFILNEIINNASNPHKNISLIPKKLNHMMYHMKILHN